MVDLLVQVHWESCAGTGKNRIYRANDDQYRVLTIELFIELTNS